MKMVTTGIVAAATLLSGAPTLAAIDVDIGPGGITVGPQYRDYEERSYFRDRAYYRDRELSQ